MDQISVESSDLFLVSSNGHSANVNIELQGYRAALQKVVIQVSNYIRYNIYILVQYRWEFNRVPFQGVIGVNRAVIHEESVKGVTRYKLLVEGDNLRDVIATPGVKEKLCTSNNTYQVYTTLGIEAAR